MDDRFRTSDADRDRAAALLRDHFVAGRLTPEELDARLTATLNADTKTGSRWARGSEPWPERWQGVRDGVDLSGWKGRGAMPGGGSGAAGSWGLWLSAGVQAASGGLMVMVMVRPGWSFCSWRSRYAWRWAGDSRRV
jgi:hypothetical protein